MLETVTDSHVPHAFTHEETLRDFEETVEFWRRWLSQSRYRGRWRETVHRSALVLKLLTYKPSGAMVAAPTTSLPEQIGGGRNWDYRYTWIRDTAFSLYALLRLGFTDEAAGFMDWLTDRFRERVGHESGPLQIMYGVDGSSELTEEILDHLEGYRRSGPVRIGNGAANQLQLDIYGELIDSVYLFNKHATPISHGAGATSPASSSGSARTGTRPTRASGKRAVGARTSRFRASCPGSPSSGLSGWRASADCRPTFRGGRPSATTSTAKSWSEAGTPNAAHSSSTTTRKCSTHPCC